MKNDVSEFFSHQRHLLYNLNKLQSSSSFEILNGAHDLSA